jgi:hypothetical protein
MIIYCSTNRGRYIPYKNIRIFDYYSYSNEDIFTRFSLIFWDLIVIKNQDGYFFSSWHVMSYANLSFTKFLLLQIVFMR